MTKKNGAAGAPGREAVAKTEPTTIAEARARLRSAKPGAQREIHGIVPAVETCPAD
jgi:hypothetical protein